MDWKILIRMRHSEGRDLPRCKREDNINVNLEKTEWKVVSWIYSHPRLFAQDGLENIDQGEAF
jgi:hypothetical protein